MSIKEEKTTETQEQNPAEEKKTEAPVQKPEEENKTETFWEEAWDFLKTLLISMAVVFLLGSSATSYSTAPGVTAFLLAATLTDGAMAPTVVAATAENKNFRRTGSIASGVMPSLHGQGSASVSCDWISLLSPFDTSHSVWIVIAPFVYVSIGICPGKT